MTDGHIGGSEFDRDTAVRPREPGVFDADISAGWSISAAINGGYLKAMLGRALGRTLPHPDPFTVTAHYLTATRPGPAVIRTSVARTGNTLSTGSASLFQTGEDGREVERIRLLGTYGDLDALPADVRTAVKPPQMPPYEHCVGVDQAPADPRPAGQVEMLHRLASRLDPATVGWALGKPSGRGEIRGWFAFADGRDADPLALLLIGDAMPPTAFDLGLSGWVPTVELTTHVRARPAPGPLRVAIGTRNLAGGFLEEDVEIWDSADRMVAQSRQLARALLA
ncbi:thioesterase family protein [Streptomyces sodiiphilus]|uniref:Thioesterase family protein n=1 Tax=Streptomyces sodiiphilus TaxID=226217 RepID=A0ABN2P649_9ACTN